MRNVNKLLREIRDKKRKEFVTEMAKADLQRDPTEDELNNMGRAMWDKGFDACYELIIERIKFDLDELKNFKNKNFYYSFGDYKHKRYPDSQYNLFIDGAKYQFDKTLKDLKGCDK